MVCPRFEDENSSFRIDGNGKRTKGQLFSGEGQGDLSLNT